MLYLMILMDIWYSEKRSKLIRQEIIQHFRGSELQSYIKGLLEDRLKAMIKPQCAFTDHEALYTLAYDVFSSFVCIRIIQEYSMFIYLLIISRLPRLQSIIETMRHIRLVD